MLVTILAIDATVSEMEDQILWPVYSFILLAYVIFLIIIILFNLMFCLVTILCHLFLLFDRELNSYYISSLSFIYKICKSTCFIFILYVNAIGSNNFILLRLFHQELNLYYISYLTSIYKICKCTCSMSILYVNKIGSNNFKRYEMIFNWKIYMWSRLKKNYGRT